MSIKHIEARYIGDSNLSFDKNKKYQAVGYDSSLKLVSIVDESNENYLYSPEAFEFDGDYKDLPEDFPNVYRNNGKLQITD